MKPSTSALTLSALGTMFAACEPCLDLRNGDANEKTLSYHITEETGVDYSKVQEAICEVSQNIQRAVGKIQTGKGSDADLFQVAIGFGKEAYIETEDGDDASGKFLFSCVQPYTCIYTLNVKNPDYYDDVAGMEGPWAEEIDTGFWGLNTNCNADDEGSNYFEVKAKYILKDGKEYESASGEYPCWETTTIDSD